MKKQVALSSALFLNFVASVNLRHFAEHGNDRTIAGCGKFDGSRYGLRIKIDW